MKLRTARIGERDLLALRIGLRVRENAEGIALYNGEQREADQLNLRFADIFANGWRVLLTQAQLAFYQAGYQQLAGTLTS